jgi:hypothetical protein
MLPLWELETKAKTEAFREMFPNEVQPFTGLETKTEDKVLRKMFPNGMQPLRELDTKAKAVVFNWDATFLQELEI